MADDIAEVSRPDYVELALRTESKRFDTENVPAADAAFVLQLVVTVSEMADVLKRALFYGKPLDEEKMSRALTVLSGFMAPRGNELSAGASWEKVDRQLVHAILGKISETGEIALALDQTFYGHPFDLNNLFEEQGDLCWYDALLFDACRNRLDPACSSRWNYGAVQAANIAKLTARYPEKFTTEKAHNRDLAAEAKAMDNHVRKADPAATCEFDGCDNKQAFLAYSRNKQRVMAVCSAHHDQVSEEGSPEYSSTCANCGCSNPEN